MIRVYRFWHNAPSLLSLCHRTLLERILFFGAKEPAAGPACACDCPCDIRDAVIPLAQIMEASR
jgi:hypothetical protein